MKKEKPTELDLKFDIGNRIYDIQVDDDGGYNEEAEREALTRAEALSKILGGIDFEKVDPVMLWAVSITTSDYFNCDDIDNDERNRLALVGCCFVGRWAVLGSNQ